MPEADILGIGKEYAHVSLWQTTGRVVQSRVVFGIEICLGFWRRIEVVPNAEGSIAGWRTSFACSAFPLAVV